MKVLMHLCCSNCAIWPLERFLIEGIDVKGFWYNPNIHPYAEYEQRMDSVARLAGLWNLDVEYEDEYPLDHFLKAVVGAGPERCRHCYEIRLERTAAAAKQMGLKGFTTSLLASPYQKFDMIIEAGHRAAASHGIAFLGEDFRDGWHLSRPLSLELGLYRQRYCGCIYSEMERNRKKALKRK